MEKEPALTHTPKRHSNHTTNKKNPQGTSPRDTPPSKVMQIRAKKQEESDVNEEYEETGSDEHSASSLFITA